MEKIMILIKEKKHDIIEENLTTYNCRDNETIIKLFYFVVISTVENIFEQPYAITIINTFAKVNNCFVDQDDFYKLMGIILKMKLLILHGYLQLLYINTSSINDINKVLCFIKKNTKLSYNNIDNYNNIDILRQYIKEKLEQCANLFFDDKFVDLLLIQMDQPLYKDSWETENRREIINRLTQITHRYNFTNIDKICNFKKISKDDAANMLYEQLAEYYTDCGNRIRFVIDKYKKIMNVYNNTLSGICRLLKHNNKFISKKQKQILNKNINTTDSDYTIQRCAIKQERDSENDNLIEDCLIEDQLIEEQFGQLNQLEEYIVEEYVVENNIIENDVTEKQLKDVGMDEEMLIDDEEMLIDDEEILVEYEEKPIDDEEKPMDDEEIPEDEEML